MGGRDKNEREGEREKEAVGISDKLLRHFNAHDPDFSAWTLLHFDIDL